MVITRSAHSVCRLSGHVPVIFETYRHPFVTIIQRLILGIFWTGTLRWQTRRLASLKRYGPLVFGPGVQSHIFHPRLLLVDEAGYALSVNDALLPIVHSSRFQKRACLPWVVVVSIVKARPQSYARSANRSAFHLVNAAGCTAPAQLTPYTISPSLLDVRAMLGNPEWYPSRTRCRQSPVECKHTQ